MFERYTETARRVIFFARYEASQLGEALIEPHHLLLGVMREDKQVVTRLCKSKLPPTDYLRDRIKAMIGSEERYPTAVDLPLSTPAKRALAYAAEESERLSQRHIGTEHLLLGLLREGTTIAAKILNEYGVNLDDISHEIRAGIIARADNGQASRMVEIRILATEARQLAAEIVEKAERLNAICDQLTEHSSEPDE
jgi:ATP-dependent Clp protease ATP-binding subunit ClpC